MPRRWSLPVTPAQPCPPIPPVWRSRRSATLSPAGTVRGRPRALSGATGGRWQYWTHLTGSTPVRGGDIVPYGHFDDDRREYVITQPETPAALDQLPGHRGLLRHHLQHRRRLFVLPRRAAAPLDPLPLQQRPLRPRGPLPVPAGRLDRRVLVAVVAADADATSRLTSAATACPTRSSRRSHQGISAETLYFVPLGETLEVWRLRVRNERPRAGAALGLLLGGVLPLGRPGRRHQLPAQLQHRPRWRWRAASSTTRPSTANAATTSPTSPAPCRWPASTPSGRRSSAPTGAGTARWPSNGAGRRLDRPRLGAARVSPRAPRPGARREHERSFSSSVTPRTPSEKFDPPGSQTINKRAVRPVIEHWLQPATVEDGPQRLRDVLGRHAREPARDDARRRHRPDGQHMERVPVHGDFQPQPVGVVLRVGDRRGAWGSATRARTCSASSHMVPERRAAAHPRHRLDAAALRRRLPPVPAAHQAGQRRHRLGFQRRPALARPGRRRLPERDGRLRDPATSRSPTTTSPGARRPSTTTCAAASPTPSSGSARTGCPLIGRADWNDCLNLNCFSDDSRASPSRSPRTGRVEWPSRCSSPACSCSPQRRWRPSPRLSRRADEAAALERRGPPHGGGDR